VHRKIIDNGDGGLVTAVFTLKKSLNKGIVDVAKKILDRLVFHHRPFRSYGALKDTYTLRVLIKNGFNILCSPQGILRSLSLISYPRRSVEVKTYLLKPYLKVGIKNRDEGDWLLPWSLRNCQKVCCVFRCEKLFSCKWIGLEERLDEWK
jgi:hypothetical protein